MDRQSGAVHSPAARMRWLTELQAWREAWEGEREGEQEGERVEFAESELEAD